MKLHRRFVIALLALAPAAGYFLLPGEDERISMLLREGRHREAAATLEQRLATGDSNPQLLASLARATEAAGNIPGAIELMKKFVGQRPRDPTGFDYLAGLQLLAGSPAEMIASMTTLVSIEPNPERVARLAGFYRLYGRFDDEFDLLKRTRNLGVSLKSTDLVRLGEYLAAKGDRLAAISPLLEADPLLPPEVDRGRVLLFDVLLAAERYDEAVSRAMKWIEQWREPWIATRLVRRLPARTPEKDVARLSATAIRLFPETSFYIAKTVAAQGRSSVAAGILSRWASDEPTPTLAQIGGLVEVSGVIGDPTLLWRLLPVILGKPKALEAQSYFLDALANKFGDGAIVSLMASIPQPILLARPLFAARFALRTGDQRLALRYLTGARLADMSAADQRVWVDLLAEATSSQAALALLLDRRRRGELPAELLPKLAEVAGQLGHPGEQMLILKEISNL
jgi:tetratricopeptide (TPR) repeat protein